MTVSLAAGEPAAGPGGTHQADGLRTLQAGHHVRGDHQHFLRHAGVPGAGSDRRRLVRTQCGLVEPGRGRVRDDLWALALLPPGPRPTLRGHPVGQSSAVP